MARAVEDRSQSLAAGVTSGLSDSDLMLAWCQFLNMLRICDDFEEAFRGLCEMVRANPSGALSAIQLQVGRK